MAEDSDSVDSFGYDHGTVRIKRVERFDEDFDRLWEAVRPDFKLVVKRDAAYLNWRYKENPVAHYRVIAAQDSRKEDVIEGYLVSTIQERGGISLGLIVDLLVKDGRTSVFRELISDVNRHFKREGVSLAACLLNRKSPYAGKLFRHGYLPVHDRINPKKFHVVCSLLGDDLPGSDTLLDFDHWHLTWGDTDNV